MGSGAAKTRAQSKLLAAICAATTAYGAAQASPWTRIDGEMLVISRADYFHSDLTSQDPQGGSFRALNNDTYIEYGLTDDVMLGGKVVYGSSWLTNSYTTSTDTGFSEFEAYAQYQLLRNSRDAVSVKLSAGRPAAFHPGARANISPGGADIELTALYGRNIIRRPIKIFAAVEAGYRKRIGAPADRVKTQLTIGVEPSKRWVFLAEAFSTTSVRNKSVTGADYDLIKLQPSIVYRFNTRWAVQAGVSQDVSTRNLAPGRSYFFSLWSAF